VRAANPSPSEHELGAAGPGLVGNVDVLRSVLSASGDCIKILDLDGRLQFMSEGGKRVMEVEDFDKLKGCPWPDFWEGAGHLEAKQALATAVAGGAARFTGAANTAAGNPKYWDVNVSPILGEDGKPSHVLSISRDITEEHRSSVALDEASARQDMLTRELEHRIKNTLTTVSAIANQTFQGDQYADVRQAFISRLIALGHAHDVLTRGSWVGAPIGEVVEAALAPHRMKEQRIHVAGPFIELEARQALSLALAVHELATNALKYGSLSTESGNVDISWCNGDFAHSGFRFTWLESGGPAVSKPTRRGFGSRLIERVLASDFGGNVELLYRPEGIKCELRSQQPISASLDSLAN
jgi:two-component sensor histidine kinase